MELADTPHLKKCLILEPFGISPKGRNLKTFKNKIKQMELDCSHFSFQKRNKGLTSDDHQSIKKKPIKETLIENSG